MSAAIEYTALLLKSVLLPKRSGYNIVMALQPRATTK